MSYLFFFMTISAAKNCNIAMSNLKAAGRSKNVTDSEYNMLLDLVAIIYGGE